ncbi:MAG TPA: signal peptidase I [Acidobacteriaceae bacterium]
MPMNSSTDPASQVRSEHHRTLWVGLAVVVSLLVVAAIVSAPSAYRQLVQTRVYTIASESMEPTIYAGDRVTVDAAYYSQHPVADGDIIAFRHNGITLLKRISAVPDETIEGKDDKLIRNGVVLVEPYLHPSDEPSGIEEASFPSRAIPDGQVFVTGDWRSRSLDSRDQSYGLVHTADIVGKVVYLYASSHPNQLGRKF